MDVATHLHHLRVESAALLAACQADPTAPVATCPGWDRRALLAHVAVAHSWVRTQIETGTGERVRLGTVDRPPEGDGVEAWYEANVAALIERLSAMDVTATWPTWAGPQPGTFYPRRMAHETAIHRRDADPVPLDAALAVDGIDELTELFIAVIPPDRLEGITGTIHLHATDIDGEWLVHLTPSGLTAERGHAKGDVALRGTASDLLLWGWNRAELDARFEVFGDPALLALWRRAVTV